MDLREPLRSYFGFAEFREGQEAVVRSAVEGRDLLALMPTGSGKSLTYQLAAMLRPSPTLVLSPLIALMKDQLDKLPTVIADQATFVNSSLDASEAAERIEGVRSGRTRLLYAAPERLLQRGFVEMLRDVGIGMVVIDEVHCVSMWGHDFRPDYLFIREVLDQLGGPSILGMTATATPRTADEIGLSLGRPLEVVRTSVARPNLRYDVELVANQDERLEILLDRLRALDGATAIVYARSRRACEETARTLHGHGLRFEHYHAGLSASERTRVQEAFGHTLQGVVATTAFGMGIDKPDVRLVCQLNLPDSLESYVQMVGRAGRDGEPSDTLLLASRGDASALRRFAIESIPATDDLRRVYRELRNRDGSASADDLVEAIGDRYDPRVLVGMLERAGLVRRGFDVGRRFAVELLPSEGDAGVAVEELLARYRLGAIERADHMIRFAESRTCRHAQVLAHFGETHRSGSCGACDICAPRAPRRERTRSNRALPSDLARSITDAVGSLRWPLGVSSLVAMLRGSVKAPPSARRSPAFGLLEAATEGQVRRWVALLLQSGALVPTETDDGFKVLLADPEAPHPALDLQASARSTRKATGSSSDQATTIAKRDQFADDGDPLVARLRSWRSSRSVEDGVPAYVILHDSTLYELSRRRPATPDELAGVRGLGPAKVERYGTAILEVLGTAH